MVVTKLSQHCQDSRPALPLCFQRTLGLANVPSPMRQTARVSLRQKGQSMTTAIETGTDWVALAQQLGTEFAPRAAAHDADDSFVAENFDLRKQHSIFAAGVPQELGGGGITR